MGPKWNALVQEGKAKRISKKAMPQRFKLLSHPLNLLNLFVHMYSFSNIFKITFKRDNKGVK